MKLRVFVTLAAVGFAVSALVAESADAAPYSLFGRFEKEEKKDDKKKSKDAKETKSGKEKEKEKDKPKKEEPAGPGDLKKRIALAPKGLRWGMSLEQIAKLYDKEFDAEFLPLYKKVEPGPRMQELDAELAERKALLRRTKVEFGNLPTGVDNGPLKGEYSYGNGESMARVTLRSGTERHVFFFGDKLWKIYDEHKLRKGGTLGESFDEAVKILIKRFGAPPKMLEADFKAGRNFPEAQWRESSTVIRAVNRQPVLGMVYVDRSIQDDLASYRKNKLENPHAIDKDVEAVTRKPEPAVDPSKEKKGDKAKAKPKSKEAPKESAKKKSE